jgi:hypothetical protein
MAFLKPAWAISLLENSSEKPAIAMITNGLQNVLEKFMAQSL